jgi:glycosyltransferase 2 family protein
MLYVMSLNNKTRSKLVNLAKVLVTLVLLTIIALTVDLHQVWNAVSKASWLHLLLAFGLYQAGIVVRTYRWQILLRAQEVSVPFIKLLDLYYVGTSFNNFLPTGFGGDVVKMFELTRYGANSELAVSTVLADRIIGLVILFVMALLALPFSIHLVPTSFIIALLAIISGLALLLILFLNQRLVRYLRDHFAVIRRLLARPKVAAFYNSFTRYNLQSLWKSMLASLLFNVLLISVYMLLGISVSVNISIIYYLIFIPIISSLLILPISVSGLGVREGGFVLLFGQAGVINPQALAISLLFYALNLVTGAVGGILYLTQSVRSVRR